MRIFPAMAPDDVDSLRRILASGEAMLFTGAGFSASAFATNGGTIPSTEEVTRAIWDLCFPDEPQDASTLTDLFHHASRKCPEELDALLKQTLCVRGDGLPDFYGRWFSVPWRRVWTLNVDDIEVAAARRFELPRRVESLSALTQEFDERLLRPDVLPFIHLNGSVHDGIRHVTFSTTQYGRRLAQFDAWYARFVKDLVTHPFVIVGTKLEEAPLWQSLQASHGHAMDGELAVCSAYIVSTSLTRARRELLGDLGIRWLPWSAEEFAERVLSPPLPERRAPHDGLRDRDGEAHRLGLPA